MKITPTHVYFYGGELSNWFPCQFSYPVWYDKPFENTEQAFMFMKAHFFIDSEQLFEILKDPTPSAVKAAGRKIKDYDDTAWNCVRYGYMVFVNYLKFSQNPEMKKFLLETGNRILVEASPVDRIWGVGLSETDEKILDEKNWLGLNLLGKALMDVRKML